MIEHPLGHQLLEPCGLIQTTLKPCGMIQPTVSGKEKDRSNHWKKMLSTLPCLRLASSRSSLLREDNDKDAKTGSPAHLKHSVSDHARTLLLTEADM